MGQTLIQTKQQVTPEADTFLLKYLPQFQFKKMLSADSIFFKSVLCENDTEGFPIVCKIYFKKEMNPTENNIYMRHVKSLKEIKDTYNPNNSPNVAPILLVNDFLQKAGLIIRQYYTFNLKERMASMPYLTKIEKKWISFQILYGLSQIHNKGTCHGNIKLENILLSSNMSVFLCDMAPYKPAYIQEDDVGSFTYYFGGSSSVNSCYLAPERLVDRQTLNDLSSSIYKITSSMDVFSCGVVIAELFLEDILFDHAKLLQYKYNRYNLEPILNKIKDEKLERLLLGMLTVDPNKRIDINNSLEFFSEEISPVSFSRMFIHFNNLTINSGYWKPDKRISLFRYYWKQIWKTLFGVNNEAPELFQNLNHNILNKLILDDPLQKANSNYENIYFFKLIFNLDTEKELNLISENEKEKISEIQNRESSYILINFILSAILNTKYASSVLCAIEMLKHLANNFPYEKDLIKIQIIIPYLCKLFKDNSNLIKFSALYEVIEMLSEIDIENLILPSSDYNFFDAYVFPNILELYNSNEPALILAFSSLIDNVTDLEQKFLQISMKSRFLNMKNMRNSNEMLLIQNTQDAINSGNKSLYGFYSGFNTNNSKGEEIIQNYDQDLYEFKFTLFKIIEDILSRNEDIDIQRILIKKLPNLMIFAGRRETSTFTKFIISNFNRRDWIIHREIFQSFPSLVISLGEKDLNEFIIPCMDMIISNNLNELKIYEMIKSMHMLLKMNYLETKSAIDLFKKILPYILHPNTSIRNEVINFAVSLIKNQTPAEIYTHLRPDLKNYIAIPFLTINNELLKNNVKDKLSRIIYELNIKGIKYILQPNLEDKEAYSLLELIINIGKMGLQNGKNNENEKLQFDKQMNKLKNNNNLFFEGISVANIIKKEFLKSIKVLNNFEDIKFYETIFLGKIISTSSIIDSLHMPQMKNRKNSYGINCNYNGMSIENYQKDGIIFQDNFRVKFLFKSLDISVKDDICIDDASFNKSFKSSSNVSSLSQKNLSQSNYMANWRPTGKLISTFCDHDNSTIEKLIPLPSEQSNRIISVGGDGKLILYDFYEIDNNIFIDKTAESKAEYIQYNRAITAIDSNSFAIGYKNKINIYKVENFNNVNNNISNSNIVQSYTIPDENNENYNIINLSCYLRNDNFGYNVANNINTCNNNNKTLVYTNQKGKIFIFDLRCSKKVLSNNFGVCRGLFSSIDWGKDDKSLFISTYGGYILNYDFRLNHIVESYKIFDNIPIINLKTFIPPKQKEFETNLSCNNNNSSNLNNIYSSNNYNSYNNPTNANNYYGNVSSNNLGSLNNNNQLNNYNTSNNSNFSSSLNNNMSNFNTFSGNNIMNNNNNFCYNNYILISTATGEHDLSLWNLNTLTCEYLFKTNTINGKEQKPLLTEIPNMMKISNRDFNKEACEAIYKNLTKLNTNRLFNNILKESIDSDFYLQSNKRLSKINNIYSNYSSVQVICCPTNIKLGDSYSNNNSLKENVPFIISAGNDMSIRYWDIRKDKANNKSYIINCPNKVDWVTYNTSCFDKTLVLQSDEYLNLENPKKNCPNFSEFQNKNGVGYHTAVQNEFVDNSGDFLQFCTSLSDASHKDFITDLHVMNINKSEKTVLISSSWDGNMKVWK